jgi:hypothetical protein
LQCSVQRDLVNSVFAVECEEGSGEQRVCYALCRGFLVNSEIAMQCAEWLC